MVKAQTSMKWKFECLTIINKSASLTRVKKYVFFFFLIQYLGKCDWDILFKEAFHFFLRWVKLCAVF